jgi:hypothetical protein
MMNFEKEFWNGRGLEALGKLRLITARHPALIPKLNCPASAENTGRAQPKAKA